MGRGEREFGGAGEDPAAVPTHAVFQALALVEKAAQTLDGVATWSLSDGELRDAVAGLFTRLQGVEAGWLGLVRDLDARAEAVPGARAGEVAKTFLVHRLRQTPATAARDVRAAHALDPAGGVLPRLAAAFAAGEVSRAHVDVAVTARANIPKRMLDHVDPDSGRSGSDLVDEELTSHARAYSPKTAHLLAGHLLAALDPTGRDRFDPDAYLRRRLSCVSDSTGMLIGRFQLDPAGSAVFSAALDRFSAPAPASAAASAAATCENGQQTLLGDERTSEQRRADALVTIARLALRHAGDTTPSAPLTHVSVIATPEQLLAARSAAGADGGRARAQDEAGADAGPGWGQGEAAGADAGPGSGQSEAVPEAERAPGRAECLQSGPISIGTLGRLACDAVLQAVLLTRSGAVLDLGRAVRTVSMPQRRALIARDHGCVVPGCTAPVAACEAHHVTWWRHGGPTSLENLAMLCGQHHTAVHAGIWVITMRDGVPWLIPPPWVTADRTPVRGGGADARASAGHLGEQLRLGIQEPPGHRRCG